MRNVFTIVVSLETIDTDVSLRSAGLLALHTRVLRETVSYFGNLERVYVVDHCPLKNTYCTYQTNDTDKGHVIAAAKWNKWLGERNEANDVVVLLSPNQPVDGHMVTWQVTHCYTPIQCPVHWAQQTYMEWIVLLHGSAQHGHTVCAMHRVTMQTVYYHTEHKSVCNTVLSVVRVHTPAILVLYGVVDVSVLSQACPAATLVVDRTGPSVSEWAQEARSFSTGSEACSIYLSRREEANPQHILRALRLDDKPFPVQLAYTLLIQLVYNVHPALFDDNALPVPSPVKEAERWVFLHNDVLETLNMSRFMQHYDRTTTAVGKQLLRRRFTSPSSDPHMIEQWLAVTDAVQHLASVKTVHTMIQKTKLPTLIHHILNTSITSPDWNLFCTELTRFGTFMDGSNMKTLATAVSYQRGMAHTLSSELLCIAKRHGVHSDGIEPPVDLEPFTALCGIIQETVSTLNTLYVSWGDTQSIIRTTDARVCAHELEKRLYVDKHRLLLQCGEHVRRIENTLQLPSTHQYVKRGNRIKFPDVPSWYVEYRDTCDDTREQCQPLWEHFLHEVRSTQQNALDTVIHCIAQIDVALSTVAVAEAYKLVRPRIDTAQDGGGGGGGGASYVQLDSARHLLVEQNQLHNTVYVPHSLTLQPGVRQGAIVTGVNSAGKSMLLKTIASTILLAQSGMYVPATKMVLAPYKHIAVRNGNADNIQRNESSFQREIIGMDACMHIGGPHTLVIADEPSISTEQMPDAMLIVKTFVEELVSLATTVVISTHMRTLYATLDDETKSRLAQWHIGVEERDGVLYYTHELRDGPCPLTNYGIRRMMDIATHHGWKKRMQGDMEQHVGMKRKARDPFRARIPDTLSRTSNYNKHLTAHTCSVPGCTDPARAEVHHIIPQAALRNGQYSQEIVHHPRNLVPLCKRHHMQTDGRTDEPIHLEVAGRVLTSNGIETICQETPRKKRRIGEQLQQFMYTKMT